jgi:hypothetical protein
MKLGTCLGAAIVVLFGGVYSAQAQVYVNDNFDGYADQAAFEAVWTPLGCAAGAAACGTFTPQSVQLNQDTSVSAPNSVYQGDITEVGTNSNAQRNRYTFATAAAEANDTPQLVPGQKLTFSFDFYDNAPALSPYRQYAQVMDGTVGTGTNQLIAMGLNNNQTAANSGGNFYMARIVGYNPTAVPDPQGGPAESVGGSGAFFKLNDYGTSPLRSEGWHNLKVEISTSTTASTAGYDYNFYVDGALAETVSGVGSTLTFGTKRRYDNVVVGSGLTAVQDGFGYYDNFFLELTEPTFDNADFNEDGTIDAADYVTWQKHFGAFGGDLHQQGDANEDGVVDDLDYDEWAATFGDTPGAGAGGGGGAVPEPTTVAMLMLGLAALVGRRRGR